MTYVITEPCVAVCDTGCVSVCPVDCIVGPKPVEQIKSIPKKERNKILPQMQLFINPEECICCAACEPECPVNAIFEISEVPEKWHSYIEKNAQFFEGSEL